VKVLGVVGGAKREGNTSRLVEEVITGARETGHEAILFRLADMKIGHLGNEGGRTTFPDDDFRQVMPHIETMGALVIGSPIWEGTADSYTHVFLHRLYYYSKYYCDENVALFPKDVKAINIITYGQKDPCKYDKVLEWLAGVERVHGIRSIRSIVAEGTGDRPVAVRADLLNRARRIGRKL
jgi:multimeric flavodoxin WrbA